MVSAVISVLILGLLILIHELGHFVAARWAGVRILRLSMGFGPRLFTRRRGHTEYALSLIPLGGYVKMAGEQQEERAHEPWEYLSKPLRVRAGIVFAGPLMNYALAALTLWVVFVIGYPELLPVVGEVKADMPASSAGLAEGDRIVAVNGQPVTTWEELTDLVSARADQRTTLRVQRGEAAREIVLTPKREDIVDPFGRPETVGRIGITPKGDFEIVKIGPLAAIGRSFEQQGEWIGQTFLALGSLVTGRVSMRDSMTGPIGILHLTSDAVKMGIRPVLYFVSLISLMLGIFNLFPIPILDGGHLLFIGMEGLRGRPVSSTVQERAAQVSLALLITLVLITCVNDVNRFWLNK